MPREWETPAVDWRAEAEARGRAAFEAARRGAPRLVGIPKGEESR